MKSSLILIVFSILAANVGVGHSAEVFNIPVGKIADMNIPAVRMAPLSGEAVLDKSLQSAIDNLKKDQANADLVQDFVCLKVFGSYDQKSQFVNGRDRVFVMPARCQQLTAESKQNITKGVIGDAVNSAAKWVCKSYTHAVTYWQCDSNNENCDEKVRDVVEQSCNWE